MLHLLQFHTFSLRIMCHVSTTSQLDSHFTASYIRRERRDSKGANEDCKNVHSKSTYIQCMVGASLGPTPKPTPARRIASSDTGSDPRWGGLGLGPRLGGS